jgi:hypothetical protein
MTAQQCVCGFTEVAGTDETIGDHLFEMFAPDADIAADGTEHLEGARDLFCLCGIGGSAEILEAHFLEVFTPIDLVGLDGNKHQRVTRDEQQARPRPCALSEPGRGRGMSGHRG